MSGFFVSGVKAQLSIALAPGYPTGSTELGITGATQNGVRENRLDPASILLNPQHQAPSRHSVIPAKNSGQYYYFIKNQLVNDSACR